MPFFVSHQYRASLARRRHIFTAEPKSAGRGLSYDKRVALLCHTAKVFQRWRTAVGVVLALRSCEIDRLASTRALRVGIWVCRIAAEGSWALFLGMPEKSEIRI